MAPRLDHSNHAGAHDLEVMLPLSMIRDHTKTNDIPSVTDTQLILYRRAAVEAAQAYTGLLLTERRSIQEAIAPDGKSAYTRRRPQRKITVRHAFADPVAYIYGTAGTPPRAVNVNVGSRKAIVPILHGEFEINNCCDPCGKGRYSDMIQYSAGFQCLTQVPAVLVLGCLKYITHVMENPGDIVVATNEAGGKASGQIGLSQSANPAVASGAIELWRSVDGGAI